jgi:hypothetical protein
MEGKQSAALPYATGRPIKIGLFLPFGERMLDGETPRWTDLLAMAQSVPVPCTRATIAALAPVLEELDRLGAGAD